MNCYAKNSVSVWYGVFSNDDELFDFIKIVYPDDEDEDCVSEFLKAYPIDDFDEDFSERVFFNDRDEWTKINRIS